MSQNTRKCAAGLMALATLLSSSSMVSAETLQLMSTTLSNDSKSARAASAGAIADIAAKAANGQALGANEIGKANAAILSLYGAVESQCAYQLTDLQSRRGEVSSRKAGISAAGALISLLGSVTVYAPAKTVLMGVGISSASGSTDSVLGVFASDAGNQVTLTQTQIDDLKRGYNDAIAKYNQIAPASDLDGMNRLNALIATEAACDGLAAALSSPKP